MLSSTDSTVAHIDPTVFGKNDHRLTYPGFRFVLETDENFARSPPVRDGDCFYLKTASPPSFLSNLFHTQPIFYTRFQWLGADKRKHFVSIGQGLELMSDVT